jgi:hypothetical protein
MALHRKGDRVMYRTDCLVGKSHREAVRWIEANDLWDEVVDLITDCYGIVIKVVH